MDAAKSNQGEEKGVNKTVGVVVVLVIIILNLAGVIGWLLLARKPEEKEQRNVVMTPDNVQSVIEQMAEQGQEPVPIGYYTVSMSYEWHFETGSKPSSDAYVENVVGNTNAVYLDVFLAGDEGNAIYKSPVIPVGSYLQDIALDTSLDAGTYDCVAVYHLVDDDQNTVSTLRMTVTIIVEG